MKQKTLTKELTWSGIGLHTGVPSSVKVAPANSNFGIKFKRIDNASDAWIPADVKYVSSTRRSTSLKSGDCEIKTVEHLLGALYGLGIDNAIVEVDGPELPILDGSGTPYSSAIMASGVTELEEDKKVFELQEIVEYKDDSGAEYIAVPGDSLILDVLIDFGNKTIGHPHAALQEGDDPIEACAGARTFVHSEDVLALAEAGLIKGGSIDNAVVIRSKEVSDAELKEALKAMGKSNVESLLDRINEGFDLKYNNELARHKMFDLIGDLALIGASINARIWAKKPGHTGNIAFARKLKELYTRQLKLKSKPLYDPDADPLFTTTDIMSYLPHRYPLLMVDKIIELSENHVVGVKNLTFNEELFQGHFPNNPVFPGVLQMEALAQTGGILALNNVEKPSNWDTYFLKMDNVKFKRKVVPGDTLILKMELLSPIRRGIVHMQGTAYVGNHIVSEGELTAQIVDRTTLK